VRLDVFFTHNEVKQGDTMGRLVAIVDVLRASTTVATALGNSAKTVIPVEGADAVNAGSR
jgi:2-phosphosulfolactate phosphatase